jgi:purine-binding chemotaxis protein CheW
MPETPPTLSADSSSPEASAQLYDLLPFTINDFIFGVLTEQVDATAEAKPFARLPRAPGAIVGVVCVRGRMLTVLDAAAVLHAQTKDWPQPLPHVVVLRGDDQLALAAETCRDTITISTDDLERSSEDGAANGDPVLGFVTHGGEKIQIFDADRLFARAIQRRERRRRRF